MASNAMMPSELQYLKGGVIDSNSQFFYKDITSFNYDHRIKLNPECEPKMDIRNQIPTHHLSQAIIKELPNQNEMTAFEKADIEAEFTKQCSLHKYQILLQKERKIAEIVAANWKIINEDVNKSKEELRATLTRIIRDALIFSKKNNPMSAMLPNSISGIITKYKEDRNNHNISMSSLNISAISKITNKSTKKYEANEFLISLGLDVHNLSPDNIHIDIEKAFQYIKSWNSNRKDINEVLKYLLVNKIMSIEEKRASQKVEILNKKLKKYKEKKKVMKSQQKKDLEAAIRDDGMFKIPKAAMKPVSQKNNNQSKTQGKAHIQGRPMTANQGLPRPKSSAKVSNRLLARRGKSKDQDIPKEKKRIKYNAYQHVDKILNFISNSDELSENPPVCKHFLNIKYNKRMDDLTKKLIAKNKLETTLDSISGTDNRVKLN